MDQDRERIQADLRGLVEGEVRCDDVFLQMFASDASIYEIKPLGVVRPRGVSDVAACVQYAAENQIPVHARGAGTGLAGAALGPGLVLDFSHSMRRILGVEDDRARVQPGVVLAQLNRHLAPRGRLFGPDPATSGVTTMGSVLAMDGAGSHWLQHGSARQHVAHIQAVLANGEVIEACPTPIPADANSPAASREETLAGRLGELLRRESHVIASHQAQPLARRSGYRLHDLIDDGRIDLAKLLVGSEGTLALITEAVVKTAPTPQHCGVMLLFFDRLESAARGALQLAELGVSACDLTDRRLLNIAREADSRYNLLIPREAEAMLLVELQDAQPQRLRDRLRQVATRLQHRKRLAFDVRTAIEPDEQEFYWGLARNVVPMLYRLEGSKRPLPFVEDIAAPLEVLPDFLVRLQNVFKTHHVTASLFGHVGHGQLHVRPFLDLADPADIHRMLDLANDLYAETLRVGGFVSAEHGVGLSRTWFVRRQYGPLYDVFCEVKRIFDPQNILNPGKIVADVPQPLTKNLRPVVASFPATPRPKSSESDTGAPSAESPALRLVWSQGDIAYVARTCNGCGYCLTQSPDKRMCPIFRLSLAEEASPRAKANLLRAVLTGRLDPAELTGDTLKSFADLCVNCHQCRLECPARVDIPKLMAECKAQYVAANGLRLSDWFLTRLDTIAALGSRFHPLANWALGNRQMRWLIEKVFGVAQGRKLPRFAPRSFIRRAHRRRLTHPARRTGRKVLYFVDLYANWFDVQLAEALVAVLEHNGASVFVPPDQAQSAMASVSLGAADHAKAAAVHNVALLADAVRQGYQIVASEPAAALCLTREYLNLLDDDDARLVAAHTSEACTYLWRLHQSGQLELDLMPVNVAVGYHLPCHLRALEVGSPGEQLLRLIPGLTVHRIERGCSGMAGAFGLKRQNYRSSLRAGWGLISALRDPALQVGATECSACKIQMEQGTVKPTIHPIKLLALAYGLAPEIASLLTARSPELTVT